MTPSPSDLGTLFDRLRHAGLRVGVTEIARLDRVLALEPALDVEGLERLVTGVVAKSKDEVAAVAEVVGGWRDEARVFLEGRRYETGLDERRRRLATAPRRRRHRRQRPPMRFRRALVVGLLAGGLEAAVFWSSWPRAEPLGDLRAWTGDARVPAATTVALADAWDLALLERPKEFVTRVPILRAVPPDPPPRRVLAFLGVGLVLGGGLWLRYRGRSWLPPPEPVADRPGPSRVLLRGPEAGAPQLLAASEEEALVWGIERFVSEEASERLDVAASVAATCRHAGRPVLAFERARHHREVWLWCDRSATDSFLLRLAREVRASLEQAGLVVERADFWGVPYTLVSEDGTAMAPNELDERRDTAVVAILTDARLLALELDDAERRRGCEALLRDLGRWPRLAFVDFGDGRAASLLEHRKVPTVAPSEAFAFLGGVAQPRRLRRTERGAGDALAWEAACALASQPVDEDSAHALRQALGLEVSAWELRRLFAGGAARRGWPVAERARLLRWLWTSEALDDGGIAEDSVLGRALDFWDGRYAAEEMARREADMLEPWEGTPAEQRLHLERALLKLWREPEAATEEIYRLFGAGHEEVVQAALGAMVPADRLPPGEDGDDAVVLPWRLSEKAPRVQVMLREMGLGDSFALALPQHLRRPGRLWLAVALCLGLVVGGGIALAVVSSLAERQEIASRAGEPVGCTEELGDDAELWRCGYLEPRGDGEQNTAVLAASPGDPQARQLAAWLLDGGSVSEVLLALDWQAHIDELDAGGHIIFIGALDLLRSLPRTRTTSRVGSSDWETLATGLEFEGSQRLSEAWGKWLLSDESSVELRGIWNRPGAVRINPKDGSVLVYVPAGEYVLGADDLEESFLRDGHRAEDAKEWSSWSQPSHQVTLSGFWIARFPVINAQYARFLKASDGRLEPEYWDNERLNHEKQPVVGVNWDEASAYCQSADMVLPTEAQWEAAARGDDQRRYPWGNEEPTAALADFGKSFTKDAPSPVHAHPAGIGPYGTLGQAGNVWEWCVDVWDPKAYDGRDGERDPVATVGDESVRVVRGGSWDVPATSLASAFRVRNGSSSRYQDVGFRCVVSTPPEP